MNNVELQPQLQFYYQQAFPFNTICKWLVGGNHQQMKQLKMREFSFSLLNDAYLRFHSFVDPQELKTSVIKLIPAKIDIGAVYNSRVIIIY